MFFVFLSFKHALESPPHVRGKAMDKLCGLRTLGITPACAGKSWKTVFTKSCLQDHPRMRGEKPSASWLGLISVGSPPHARGKGPLFNHRSPLVRITPACAGKSFHDLTERIKIEDHPRMRGEKGG